MAAISNEMGWKKKIHKRKYSFFFRGFISGMVESQKTSPSDASLDFDDDTLKGIYTLNIISI